MRNPLWAVGAVTAAALLLVSACSSGAGDRIACQKLGLAQEALEISVDAPTMSQFLELLSAAGDVMDAGAEAADSEELAAHLAKASDLLSDAQYCGMTVGSSERRYRQMYTEREQAQAICDVLSVTG